MMRPVQIRQWKPPEMCELIIHSDVYFRANLQAFNVWSDTSPVSHESHTEYLKIFDDWLGELDQS